MDKPRECKCYYSIISERYGEIYIEKSAYDKLQQELELAQAQIKDYREALAFVNEEFVPDRGPTVYVGRKDLEKARQVLEKWK